MAVSYQKQRKYFRFQPPQPGFRSREIGRIEQGVSLPEAGNSASQCPWTGARRTRCWGDGRRAWSNLPAKEATLWMPPEEGLLRATKRNGDGGEQFAFRVEVDLMQLV